MSTSSVKMELGLETLQHWFREVRHEPRRRKRKVKMSQLDTYLLEMVSFQIIKEHEV